jgi:hypothetical protein
MTSSRPIPEKRSDMTGTCLGRLRFLDRQRARQDEAGELVLAGEPNAFLRLCVLDEFFDDADPRRPRQAVVEAYDHHAPAALRLGIKRLELLIERAFIAFDAAGIQDVVLEVVEVACVGHDDERLAVNCGDKRFIAAQIIDVIEKAHLLQDRDRVGAAPHALCVVSDRVLSGEARDNVDAVLNEFPLVLASEMELLRVRDAVRGAFVSAISDLLGERWRPLEPLTGEERRHFDATAVTPNIAGLVMNAFATCTATSGDGKSGGKPWTSLIPLNAS